MEKSAAAKAAVAVEPEEKSKRLRRIVTAAAETEISPGLVRKFLERREIKKFKLGSITYVDVNEIIAKIREA